MSFRRKPESSIFRQFWTPAFAGVTGCGTFYEFIKLPNKLTLDNKLNFLHILRLKGWGYIFYGDLFGHDLEDREDEPINEPDLLKGGIQDEKERFDSHHVRNVIDPGLYGPVSIRKASPRAKHSCHCAAPAVFRGPRAPASSLLL